ncbi:dioxygenase [Peribacillus saganii]|uniref:Dioxygenase n=1 Tax=Peribacillus saganii TaxID=2303992 RepID=A0A372LK57_9BACI|nr:class III extradiol ring-cleavage dioxygenase [Peribacillus saganii]RFU66406.1 dioxygenase [Peribacillus saganii]
MMPSLFLAHGAPSLVIENNSYTEFLKNLAANMDQPKAIVIFSSHWESCSLSVTAVQNHSTIHDFAGFPDSLYEITYPAKGDLDISDHLLTLFAKSGYLAELKNDRSLDHGVWVPLSIMYPDASIPVVSISVNPALSNQAQYKIGKAVKSLKRQNVLVIGSGGIVHNPEQFIVGMEVAEGWAVTFEHWIEEKLLKRDMESLLNFEEIAPFASLAVPTKEHFAPLLIAMGAGNHKRKPELLHRSFQYGNLSLSAWKF